MQNFGQTPSRLFPKRAHPSKVVPDIIKVVDPATGATVNAVKALAEVTAAAAAAAAEEAAEKDAAKAAAAAAFVATTGSNRGRIGSTTSEDEDEDDEDDDEDEEEDDDEDEEEDVDLWSRKSALDGLMLSSSAVTNTQASAAAVAVPQLLSWLRP